MDSQYGERGAANAYGAGGATGHFDPVVFIKKPQVILRLCSMLFSVVVFGCIMSQGYEMGQCNFNNVTSACGYGSAVGVMAFIAFWIFFTLDALFENMSNVAYRKYMVIADIAVSGLVSFLWFVCFCYLTDMWRKTEFKRHPSAMQAVLVFSFFSTGSFIALTGLAVQRYRQGVGSGVPNYGQDSFSQPGDASPF